MRALRYSVSRRADHHAVLPIADVFGGGVLCAVSLVIGLASSWLGLEPGRSRKLPSGLLLC